MRLKILCLFMLVTLGLQAQLVEKPTPTPKPSTRTPAKAPAAAARLPEPPKDLLDQINAPKAFRGALVDRSNDRALLLFQGTWGPAPAIAGGGSSTQWSTRAAVLADLDERGTNLFRIGFNLGRKDGKLVARMFQRTSLTQREVPAQDEGSAEEIEGGYAVNFEKSRLLFWASTPSQPWAPKQARLFRFLGNGFSTPGPVMPHYNSPAFPGKAQRGLTFGAGSYLVLEDGPIGRILFAPFGDGNLQMVRFVHDGEKLCLDVAKRPGASEGKAEGFVYFSHVWGDGLTGFGQDDSNALSRSVVSFRVRKGTTVEEVGSVSDNPLFTFTLSGTSEEVTLDDKVRGEVLDRAKDPGWALSGGPYGPRRVLLAAFAGCTIQPPSLSRDDVRQSGLVSLRGGQPTSGPAYQKWGLGTYSERLAAWGELAKEAGATFMASQPSRPNPQTGSLGRVYPPGVKPEIAPAPAKGKLGIFGR